MSRPLAVFDIDGTLVDSRASIQQAAVEAAREIGLPEPAYDAVRQIVGLSLHEALRVLAPGLTDAELAEFVAAYQAAFRRMHAAQLVEPLYDGAMDCLRRLKRDGWQLALATGQNRRGVARNLARVGWAELFDSAHCAEDGPGKPNPHMLLCAVRACDGDPARAVMIGDTGHDIRMALAAGVRAQGVGWGFHTPEEVAAAGADHVALDFAELDAALDRFAVWTLAA